MRLPIAFALALCAALALAAPGSAQQPDYQVPSYQTPGSGNQPTDNGNQAPETGGGNTPNATPGAGEAPSGAGAAPTGALPRTGFADGAFIAVLGFVLLLSGASLRRALGPRLRT